MNYCQFGTSPLMTPLSCGCNPTRTGSVAKAAPSDAIGAINIRIVVLQYRLGSQSSLEDEWCWAVSRRGCFK